MNIFDFFYYLSIDIQHGFKLRGKMYKCSRSKHGMCILNADNIHAKSFNIQFSLKGQNETAENYVGYDNMLIDGKEGLVYIREAVDRFREKYGDSAVIRSINFRTQYYVRPWRNQIMTLKHMYVPIVFFTGDREKDDAVIEKADSIFREWTDFRPKFIKFRQSDWKL